LQVDGLSVWATLGKKISEDEYIIFNSFDFQIGMHESTVSKFNLSLYSESEKRDEKPQLLKPGRKFKFTYSITTFNTPESRPSAIQHKVYWKWSHFSTISVILSVVTFLFFDILGKPLNLTWRANY